MAPMLVLALVAGWPLARTIWFGFTDANLSDLAAAEFIGLINYVYLLDPDWWNAVWNTVVFAAISVTVETASGWRSRSRSTPTAAAACCAPRC